VDPTVVPVIVTLHIPLANVVQAELFEKFTGVPLPAKLTGWPDSACPPASVTVAVAVALEVPSATMLGVLSANVIPAGGPSVWVKVWNGACPRRFTSLAVIVVDPTVLELVNVTKHVPLGSVMQDGLVGVTGELPLVAKVTVSP
jgi:hypothetical protein